MLDPREIDELPETVDEALVICAPADRPLLEQFVAGEETRHGLAFRVLHARIELQRHVRRGLPADSRPDSAHAVRPEHPRCHDRLDQPIPSVEMLRYERAEVGEIVADL